jgi:hypothetical protein
MRDFLNDIVAHTHVLGNIDLVKVVGTDTETQLEAVANDKSIVIKARFHQPNTDFKGTFGMPNLSSLNVILGIPEYKDNAQIGVITESRNNEIVPTGIHFENAAGDFKNDYRFMSMEAVNERLKSVKFRGANWNVSLTPTEAAILRFKFQANANAGEKNFVAKTENGDLKFFMGDHSTHAGNFVFHSGVNGALTKAWQWPTVAFISILNLVGDKMLQLSDDGAAMITVDSGLIVYEYILPAQTK